MAEKIADNLLMVLSIVLILMALTIGVMGVVSLFVHGFSWMTLSWAIGSYVAGGLLFSVISRDYATSLTWQDGASPEVS